MHPLGPNLTEMSDTDLHKKQGELIMRLNQAYRIGPFSVVGQLQMLLDDYNAEIQRRNQKILADLNKKGKDLDGLINIQ